MSASLTQNQASGSSLSIRGTAAGAPPSRIAANALRGAGITRDVSQSMELDGSSGGRQARGADRRNGRSGGPLDQTGRHRPSNTPYGKPPTHNDRNGGLPPRPGSSSTSTRIRGVVKDHIALRVPEGTPHIIIRPSKADRDEHKAQRAKLSDKLNSEGMKEWLRRRHISPGVMDMSGMNDDAWLKEQGIIPPGHPEAPIMAGQVFWRLVDQVVQQGSNTPIHTLSLANNNFKSLKQISRLPLALPNLRHLDLSNNPIRNVHELDELLAAGEKKGKAVAGIGSLKSLIELKLNGCQFREELLSKPDTADQYQHDILRRFPGLRILDGVSLNRIVFPIERKPKIRRNEDERKVFVEQPFIFPVDVQGGFIDSETVRTFAMSFCAKFFPLFDTDRLQLLPGYAPNATLSASANTLQSRSYQSNEVSKTRHTRPVATPFNAWTELPSRNFFRSAETIEVRMKTLKSPLDREGLLAWWGRIPSTKHPLEEADKWCIDAWVLDGEGVDTKLCVMIQGQFQQMPSGTYRSFSRTFILADAPIGSPAQTAGWPAIILSDTMVIHNYLGTGSFDSSRTLAMNGVSVSLNQIREATGMNDEFARLCLAQNGWDIGRAMKNFEEIKGNIPAEAFQ